MAELPAEGSVSPNNQLSSEAIQPFSALQLANEVVCPFLPKFRKAGSGCGISVEQSDKAGMVFVDASLATESPQAVFKDPAFGAHSSRRAQRQFLHERPHNLSIDKDFKLPSFMTIPQS